MWFANSDKTNGPDFRFGVNSHSRLGFNIIYTHAHSFAPANNHYNGKWGLENREKIMFAWKCLFSVVHTRLRIKSAEYDYIVQFSARTKCMSQNPWIDFHCAPSDKMVTLPKYWLQKGDWTEEQTTEMTNFFSQWTFKLRFRMSPAAACVSTWQIVIDEIPMTSKKASEEREFC